MQSLISEYGMNIHLIGFKIPKDLIKGSKITVKISTFPKLYKEKVIITADKMNKCNKILSINVKVPTDEINKLKSGQTEMILFTFKCKDQLQNKKIACAKIIASDFPQFSENNGNLPVQGQIKTIKINKTAKKQLKEFKQAQKNGFSDKYELTENNKLKREEIGEMRIQMSLCQKYESLEKCKESKKTNNGLAFKGEKQSKQSKSSMSMKMKNKENSEYLKFF